MILPCCGCCYCRCCRKRAVLYCSLRGPVGGIWMQSEIDLAELEAIKAKVERSLPSDVLTDMRRANVSLTLGSSSHGSFRPVVVDAGFAEEVAERELVEEMVSYRKNVTGLDHTVFISPR